MLLLLAALLPCLVWDQDSSAATKLGIDRICPAPQIDQKAVQKLPAPGVQYRMNEASATRSPWIDANGWRIQRVGSKGMFYYDVPADPSIAMAEAYAYGADALIHTDAAGLTGFGKMLAFLKGLQPMSLPVLANIGIIDDGSNEMGELMNLLARHNLLFRIVTAPDPKLVNVSKAEADANRLSHQIRSQIGDEKRLLRIYGSEVVVGRLTGDGQRARLHLIDYANRPVQGLRVRVLGAYPRYDLAVSGSTGAKLEDYVVEHGATEFTVTTLERYAVVDLGR